MPRIKINLSLTEPGKRADVEPSYDVHHHPFDSDDDRDDHVDEERVDRSFNIVFETKYNKYDNSYSFDLTTALRILRENESSMQTMDVHELPSQNQYDIMVPYMKKVHHLNLHNSHFENFTHNPATDQCLNLSYNDIEVVRVGKFTSGLSLTGKALKEFSSTCTFPRLSWLNIAFSPNLKLPDLTNFTMLTDMRFHSVDLDISDLTSLQGVLKRLQLYDVKTRGKQAILDGFVALEEVKVTTCNELEHLSMIGCSVLKYFNLQGCRNLFRLQCGTPAKRGQTINFVSGMKQLRNLKCEATKLAAVNVSGMPSLKMVSFTSCDLKDANIDGKSCPCLIHLDVSKNALKDCSLVGVFPVLKSFYGTSNKFTSVTTTCKLMPNVMLAVLTGSGRHDSEWKWPSDVQT